MSVHKSPQTLKPSERAQSDTPTERASEKPQTPEPLNLDNYVTKEEFEREISKRDQEIVSLKSRLQLTEVNLSLTQDVVHAIQEQFAALSTPPISSFKDNTTEGEKKTQEKAVAVVEGKGKEIVIKGESSFSHVLEEGEIDEPYVLEYVDSVFTAEEFTTDEAQVDEEDEFADEYAFHNDYLFNGIDEVISPTIQEAQELLKRKLERVRKALERKEREKDVILKEGPLWDEARILFDKKELTLEKNEDKGRLGSYSRAPESISKHPHLLRNIC